MAQGSKPGDGGQLPGHEVTAVLLTQSGRARGVIRQWSEILPRFWKVVPIAVPEPRPKAAARASRPAAPAR